MSFEEFNTFVSENGLGALLEGEAPTELATKLIERFDARAKEESLSELWAQLELKKQGKELAAPLTKKEIDVVLNPAGQLTDYSTQETIRYNTYSGIALTGISANFGKMLAYLFELTPISSLINPAGEIMAVGSAEYEEALRAHQVNSPEGLVQKGGFRRTLVAYNLRHLRHHRKHQ